MRAVRVDTTTDQLLDPSSSVWSEIAGEELSLSPTPVEYQITKYVKNAWKDRAYGVVKSVNLAAATNGEILAFRLEWEDSEHPEAEFPDACAIGFALSDATPLEKFGSQDDPIELWYWRSDESDKGEDVLARGFQDITPADSQDLKAAAKFSKTNGNGAEGRWSVVLARPAKADSPLLHLESGKTARFVALVWEGANEERAGIAAMTPSWQSLEIE